MHRGYYKRYLQDPDPYSKQPKSTKYEQNRKNVHGMYTVYIIYIYIDKVLQSAIEYVPEIYPFIYACYSASSSLILSDTIIESAEGVQQGDPLGPLLFCLAIHPLILRLSEFCLFYLDDGIIGGVDPIVQDDFLLIEKEAALLGLQLNRSKTELICVESASSNLLLVAHDLCQVNCDEAIFLGSPIGSSRSIDAAITNKIKSLRIMGSRLCHLQKHDALLLLPHSFAIPRILYLLRTSPCFSSSCLEEFDQLLRSLLSTVLNVCLDDNSAWLQATLPVSMGGIGVRSVVQLGPSAFLASAASAAGSSSLITRILPENLKGVSYSAKLHALSVWSDGHSFQPPPVQLTSSKNLGIIHICKRFMITY